MAFNQQNLSPGTAFFRLMLGTVMTTYGTVRLLQEPKSRSGKMLVLFGSMKAAEGATKFCPTKAISTVMENLTSENANSSGKPNIGNSMASGTQSGQNASGAGPKSGNIMQMVGNIAQKITSGSSTQSTSSSQNMGGNQNNSATGQNATNAQTIGNLAQTVAPQFSQVVKNVASMTGSQNAVETKSTQNETSNKRDTSASGNNTKSTSSSNIKQATSAKSDTKPQLDGAANNSKLDSSIIHAASKSAQKNISTPNILQ